MLVVVDSGGDEARHGRKVFVHGAALLYSPGYAAQGEQGVGHVQHGCCVGPVVVRILHVIAGLYGVEKPMQPRPVEAEALHQAVAIEQEGAQGGERPVAGDLRQPEGVDLPAPPGLLQQPRHHRPPQHRVDAARPRRLLRARAQRHHYLASARIGFLAALRRLHRPGGRLAGLRGPGLAEALEAPGDELRGPAVLFGVLGGGGDRRRWGAGSRGLVRALALDHVRSRCAVGDGRGGLRREDQ
mmetsp:Transcript_140658/g.350666  ORF Transcript_140658/g.350666 Transcript_140658/m.350666 type:complete len:242 (+) Transcript_140658:334-1059(+)